MYCPGVPEAPDHFVYWARVHINHTLDVLFTEDRPGSGRFRPYNWYGGLQIKTPEVSDEGRYICFQDETQFDQVACVDFMYLRGKSVTR